MQLSNNPLSYPNPTVKLRHSTQDNRTSLNTVTLPGLNNIDHAHISAPSSNIMYKFAAAASLLLSASSYYLLYIAQRDNTDVHTMLRKQTDSSSRAPQLINNSISDLNSTFNITDNKLAEKSCPLPNSVGGWHGGNVVNDLTSTKGCKLTPHFLTLNRNRL